MGKTTARKAAMLILLAAALIVPSVLGQNVQAINRAVANEIADWLEFGGAICIIVGIFGFIFNIFGGGDAVAKGVEGLGKLFGGGGDKGKGQGPGGKGPGEGPGKTPGREGEEGTGGTIIGIVLDLSTKKGAAGVEVFLKEAPAVKTTSDGEGKFIFKGNVPFGQAVTVVARKADYFDCESTADMKIPPIILSPTSSMYSHPVNLTIAPKKGKLHVHVIDSATARMPTQPLWTPPLPTVKIEGTSISKEVNDKGEYTFEDLPADKNMVFIASKTGGTYRDTKHTEPGHGFIQVGSSRGAIKDEIKLEKDLIMAGYSADMWPTLEIVIENTSPPPVAPGIEIVVPAGDAPADRDAVKKENEHLKIIVKPVGGPAGTHYDVLMGMYDPAGALFASIAPATNIAKDTQKDVDIDLMNVVRAGGARGIPAGDYRFAAYAHKHGAAGAPTLPPNVGAAAGLAGPIVRKIKVEPNVAPPATSAEITLPASDAPHADAVRDFGDHTNMQVVGKVHGPAANKYDYLIGLYDHRDDLVTELYRHANVAQGTPIAYMLDCAGVTISGATTQLAAGDYTLAVWGVEHPATGPAPTPVIPNNLTAPGGFVGPGKRKINIRTSSTSTIDITPKTAADAVATLGVTVTWDIKITSGTGSFNPAITTTPPPHRILLVNRSKSGAAPSTSVNVPMAISSLAAKHMEVKAKIPDPGHGWDTGDVLEIDAKVDIV